MRPSSLHPSTSPMTSLVTKNSLSLHPVFLVVQAPTEKLTANYSYSLQTSTWNGQSARYEQNTIQVNELSSILISIIQVSQLHVAFVHGSIL